MVWLMVNVRAPANDESVSLQYLGIDLRELTVCATVAMELFVTLRK